MNVAAQEMIPATAESTAKLASKELKDLAVHSCHYLAGMLAGLMIGLVAFPIFTRALSVAEYGLMDLAQRTALILTIAAKLGIQNAALRFYDTDRFQADPPSARRYFSTMFFGVAATSAVIGGLFMTAAGSRATAWASEGLAPLAYVITALVVARSLGSMLWAFLRIEERTRMFNVATVLTKVAMVALVCSLMPWAGRTAKTCLIGMAVVESGFAVVMTVWLGRRRVLNPASFDRNLFRTGVVFGMPLVVYEFAFAILGSADRFLVRWYLGAESLGVYSVAYGLAQHANDLLVTPLGLAILPIYMRLWSSSGPKKTQEFLAVSLDLFLGTAAAMLAVGAAVAAPLVSLLASTKYAGAEKLIPTLLAGLLIYATYIFIAAGLLIHNRTTLMAGLLLFSAFANIALNCLLLPLMGLPGSALATLISYAVCIGLLRRYSNRVLPLRVPLASLVKYAGSSAMAGLIGSQIDLDSSIANILARGLACVAIYLACLGAVDSRLRGAARWALTHVRERI